MVSGTVTIAGNKFNMPSSNVTVKAIFEADAPTTYTVTVQNDGNGTASASPATAAAGTEITLTATPNSGYVFNEWVEKNPTSLTIGADGKFTMPSENVSVKATFKPAALTGTASITGTLKYGQELTATLTGGNNTGNLDYKWYQNGTTQVAANNTGKYTLRADDIGKTITVKITSSVQTGEITSAATATVEKANGPAAPSVTPVACTNSSNNDGKITGVNTTMEYSAASDFSTKTACTSTVITGLANGTYYVRVAETTTHKAGAAATVIVPAYTSGALGGSASISGTAKYNEVLTAVTTSITGNTGTFSYQWKRNGTDITSATNSTYKLVEDDIGKTITVAITSSVESGTIVSSPTATVEKADGPAAPSVTPVACTNSSNNDGKITGVNTTMEYSAASDFSTKTACTSTVITGLANGTYYVRVAETTTHKAGAAATVSVPAYTSGTPTEYTITFDVNGGSGTIPSQTTSGQKLSSLPTATHSGSYSFVGWYTAASGGTQITTAYVFSANTTVFAHWTYTGGGGGVGSYTPSYTVSVDKTENGTITVSPKSASKGSIVTITVKPDKGYTLETLRALDMSGYAMELTENNGRFTFKMPASAVIVKATFMDDNTMLNFFVDVKASDYFYDAVLWAAEKGVTSGADALHFSPNAPCTRAQIVTFLWRAAGSPAPKNMSSFADVPADAFYAKAVAWAVENGITGGTGDGKFSPDATCTRAQAVTFLYRASGAPAVSGNAAFSDVAANAYYAAAVKWAEKNGITGGIGGGLFGSNNNCTRAQIVTFLYRSVK